jgi:hypothetical protein
MNDVMSGKAVETQKELKKQVLPRMNTDDTDLKNKTLTTDQHGLPRIRKENARLWSRKAERS